ncbi:hypothetical protein [uncultured Parasphingorhabdus sp.]|uniref:hypothetical protein n=1 Tax=uncultured Parasphingorhabdus sp. TaxID=2709694 RepID=UPI002AA8695D|nr:hypothetical protein [uncultured Parasphingorhabdus sp.]
MAWKYPIAVRRVRDLIEEAPVISVSRFSDEYRPLYEARMAKTLAGSGAVSPPLFDLDKGEAVLADTVQIYITITNYDDYRMDEGRETEASHAKALGFLHFYYSTCDRVTERTDAQRVDFHGARMHAVVLNEDGVEGRPAAMRRALRFVREFERVAEEANRELAGSSFDARFRVGIDVGPCVAINNGTGLEQEPMFLGSPANHAAKLTYGDEPGIFLSARVRAAIGLANASVLDDWSSVDVEVIDRMLESSFPLVTEVAKAAERRGTIKEWREQIEARSVPDPTQPNFEFHRCCPPLSEIDFADLSPSNSVRMDLASMFADLSGYTAYIDAAIEKDEIPAAVRALYVIRQELQNVVEEDFGGRKVRFIGDCIHAVGAEGTTHETDARATVTAAVSCAGALRSSFKICRQELEGLDSLGLSIGVEYGPTPITRVGIRGVRSVRLASSKATAMSESMQRGCDEDQTLLGPVARSHLPRQIEDLVDENASAGQLTYADVATAMATSLNLSTPGRVPRAHVVNSTAVPKAHMTS